MPELAAPPGPANAVMAHEATRRGMWAGVASGVGAVTGDVVMFLLMWLGVLSVLAFLPALKIGLGIVGAALMARFAWGAWRSARGSLGAEADAAAAGTGGFGRTMLLILTSPFNWAWWATAGTAVFADLGIEVIVGFFVGLAGWVVSWSLLAKEGATRIRRFREVVAYASTVLLAAFAVLIAWFAIDTALALIG